MFSFAHLADLHQGYAAGRKRTEAQGINIRENDGYLALEEAVTQMIAEEIKAVIISGDEFHTPQPKILTIIKVQEQLRRLADANIKVYMIAGNHDAPDIRMDIPASVVLNEPQSGIFSFYNPYTVIEIAEGIFAHFVSHQMYADQEENMKKIKPIDGKVNILVTHGSCFDTNMNVILHTEQSPREVVIPQSIMQMPWSYTLLGHIHERGWVGSTDGLTDTAQRKQFYAGSLVRRGFSDKACKLGRGWTKWTVGDGSFTPTFFKITERPQYDLPPINTINVDYKDIEKSILTQLKEVTKAHYSQNEDSMQEAEMPIVRQTLIGLNPKTNLSINWSKFTEYTTRFLIHRFKVVYENELKATSEIDATKAAEAVTANTDIVEVFKDWAKEEKALCQVSEELKSNVTSKSEAFLKTGQEAALSSAESED